MSADNKLIIIKKSGKPFDKYLAYDICASCEDDYKKQFKTSKIKWEANSLDEAVRLAEKYTRENEVEYGYCFYDY